ncbi:MAG TPA: hypothetical protein VEN82_05300 [Actinomycetota bacterium]|nr:hypothetical protein [Actinomycetota bacterium]
MTLDAYAVKAGTTSQLLLVFAGDADEPGAGRTSLRHDSPGATAAFVREGEPAARPVPLSAGEVGRWSAGGFVEVDPDLLPGVYQFGAPDGMLAQGSTRAVLLFRFPGATVEPVEVDLVGYDPQDAVRLGMGAISPEARIEALRGAFPRLTRRELQEEIAVKEQD